MTEQHLNIHLLEHIVMTLCLCIVIFTSCAPVKRTSSSHSRTSNRHTTITSSHSSTMAASSSNVYSYSKEYLQQNSSSLTDYCISWIGTKHMIGGTSNMGVDCSGFVYNVYKDVYGIQLPRRSGDMEKVVTLLKKEELNEGDLVFFGKGSVNHVGIFLKDDNFIHSSTSKGVIVSSLQEKYWKNNFRSCGHHEGVKNRK